MTKTLVALLMLGALAGPAQAALPHPGACGPDVRKLCPDANPGTDASFDCLKTHAQALSPACRQNVQAQDEENGRIIKLQKGFEDVCGKDAQQYCGDVRPGDGRVGQCLDRYPSEVSDRCRTFLDQTREQRRPMDVVPAPR